MSSIAAISLADLPSATSLENLTLPCGQLSSGPRSAPRQDSICTRNRGDELFAGANFSNGAQKFVSGCLLENVAAGACVQRLGQKLRLGMHCDNDYTCCRDG